MVKKDVAIPNKEFPVWSPWGEVGRQTGHYTTLSHQWVEQLVWWCSPGAVVPQAWKPMLALLALLSALPWWGQGGAVLQGTAEGVPRLSFLPQLRKWEHWTNQCLRSVQDPRCCNIYGKAIRTPSSKPFTFNVAFFMHQIGKDWSLKYTELMKG